ncbi:MAG: thioredoxin family protein [Bacteroidota bacterium]
MTIKVIGPGCMNCETLAKRTTEALQHLNIDASIEKITDIQKIASYGILRTPGLAVGNKVISQGRVPTVSQIEELLTSYVA